MAIPSSKLQTAPTQIKARLQMLSEAPEAIRPLYFADSFSGDWFLSPHGKILKDMRANAAEDGTPRPLPAPSRPEKAQLLSSDAWKTLLSSATIAERRELMRSVASGKIRVDVSKAG
jgi:hypothetical protein